MTSGSTLYGVYSRSPVPPPPSHEENQPLHILSLSGAILTHIHIHTHTHLVPPNNPLC